MKNYLMKNLILVGDEWILSYLLNSGLSLNLGVYMPLTVAEFSMAHVFEQYFKACMAKKYNYDTKEKIFKEGHNLYSMFKKLKTDSNFLPDINISQDIYDSFNPSWSNDESLSIDKKGRLAHNQDLLFLFKYTADLKYLNWKKDERSSFVSWSTNDKYAKIIYEIRMYLGYIDNDILQTAFDEGIIFWKSMAKMHFLSICITGETDYKKFLKKYPTLCEVTLSDLVNYFKEKI